MKKHGPTYAHNSALSEDNVTKICGHDYEAPWKTSPKFDAKNSRHFRIGLGFVDVTFKAYVYTEAPKSAAHASLPAGALFNCVISQSLSIGTLIPK